MADKSDKDQELEGGGNGGDSGGEGAKVDYAKLSTRETIQRSIKELNDGAASRVRKDADETARQAEAGTPAQRDRDEQGRFARKDDDAPAAAEQPVVDKSVKPADTGGAQASEVKEATTSGQPAAATTAPVAPSSWSKEKHPVWAGLSRDAQDYILQRERESQEGVQQLKRGYEEIDFAIAPYKETMRRLNQPAGQTIRQLFEWNAALAGPHKDEAFRQLAQRFQIDLSRYAPQQPQAMPNGGQQGVPDQLQPVFNQLQSWQKQIEGQLNAQQEAARHQEVQRATVELQAWAKDKPHFERVRGVMQQLVGLDHQAMQSGMMPMHGILRQDGSIDLDKAYSKAIALDEGLFAEIEAQKQVEREAKIRAEAKAEADRVAQKAAKDKEEAERAKRAGASLRPGAATHPVGKPGAQVPSGESVRDTIRRSLKEASGR